MASALVQTAILARLMPAALLLGLIACPAAAADDQRLAQAVERARQATVGILDSTPDARQSGYEARFS
ncbi:MAG TPA: hypothetical protein VGQ60_04120, partial [Nitrospiraceae bacterium]|nr:hypothetical protein [Nitrospiraceae bacterium]